LIEPDMWPPNSPDLNPVNYTIWVVLHFLLYAVYICQKSLNTTYAFKCYQQNCSWLHFTWTTLYPYTVPSVRCSSLSCYIAAVMERSPLPRFQIQLPLRHVLTFACLSLTTQDLISRPPHQVASCRLCHKHLIFGSSSPLSPSTLSFCGYAIALSCPSVCSLHNVMFVHNGQAQSTQGRMLKTTHEGSTWLSLICVIGLGRQ